MPQKVCLPMLLFALLLAEHALALDPKQELARAHAGQVVELPSGTFSGGLEVSAGVTLRGAGYQQTVIEAHGAEVAIKLAGSAARIENLTIHNFGTGIELAGVDDAAISRVVILGGTIAIRAEKVRRATIENTIVSRPLIGITLNQARNTTVVNCTITTANVCGLSVAGAVDTALFNNLVVDAGTAIVVSGANERLAIDYNLYSGLSIGKLAGQLQRPTLPTWRDVSGGLDAHSVQFSVAFANPMQNDFHPVSTVTWNPRRSNTVGWGIAELAGHQAPRTDLDGQPRVEPFGVGALEAPESASQKPDEHFEIASDNGLKSAGLFAPDNRLVAYLFQGLPLKKGTYGFMLPARDLFGRPIPPGNYELRSVESKVDWTYRGMTANAGIDNTPENSDSVHVGLVAYTPDGQLLTASGWSERHINLRLGDPATGRYKWVFQGSADCTGLCVTGGGRIILVRNATGQSVDIYQIDPATGIPIARADGRLYVNVAGRFKSQYLGGIAELDGRLFAADPDANQVLIDSGDRLEFATTTPIAKPRSPAADRKRKLVWLISNREKIVALDATGKPAHEFSGVKNPLALAVAGDRLAVAAGGSGQIEIFDISDPAQPRKVKSLGRGDGPFGPWLPDRFHFQSHPQNPNNGNVSLAMHDDGSLALRDSSGRVVTFGPAGRPLHDGFAVWGGDPCFAPFADGKLRAFDTSAAASYLIDPATGKWEPEAYWGLPALGKLELRGFFSSQGKNFGVFTYPSPDKKGDRALIASYDSSVVRPVAVYQRSVTNGWLRCRDTNHDGQIDDHDEPGQPVLDTAGKPVTNSLTARFMFVKSDGTIVHSGNQLAFVWRFAGLDAGGVPNYEFSSASVRQAKDPLVPSPYELDQTEDLRCTSTAKLAPDGGICAGINLRHTPHGMGLSNSGATDLARWNPDGTLRWLRTMNDYSPIQGVEPLAGVTISSWGHQAEFMALDDDGLELGRFGFPAAVNWSGFWVDHPQEWSALRTPDGDVQILIGDYMQNCHHWMTVRHLGSVKESRQPVTIDAAKARELAYRQPVLHVPLGHAAPPEIVIQKLPGPLPIDGNLQKWRSFPPQILMTPQNSFGKITGPADCSGVIRLAYHGHDLYGQLIAFDNVVSFHQPASRFYLEDGLQFCINGFFTGFAFNVTQTTDKGPMFFRNRFFFQKMDLFLDPAKAPRLIKKFASAHDIPERRYIESIYGVDLSHSPGYIIEFKLPLDETTYQGDEKIVPQVESGKWFWLGFFLDDNDTPGTDVQNFIAWPGTFGMFNPAEAGAKAYFQ